MAVAHWRDRLPVCSSGAFAVAMVATLAAFTLVGTVLGDQAEAVTGWLRRALFAICVVLVAIFARWQVVEARVMTWFGDTSFALYLGHPLAYLAVGVLPVDGWVRVFLATGVTLAGATLSFYVSEQPLNWLGRRLSAPRQAVPA